MAMPMTFWARNRRSPSREESEEEEDGAALDIKVGCPVAEETAAEAIFGGFSTTFEAASLNDVCC